MKFKDSAIAHKYLDDLNGIEIGAAAHNPFHLPNCINVDITDSMDTVFKQNEFILCGEKAKVDVVADGAHLPFKNEKYDYVISSHVIEHFFDPIAAIKEWLRVIKSDGYIFIICPHQKAVPEENRDCTTVKELIDRHTGKIKPEEVDMGNFQKSSVSGLPFGALGHWSVWNLPEFLELCIKMKWKVIESLTSDDKVGNGFMVIIQKQKRKKHATTKS